ncbi:MAG: mechanosensitive ion channel [Nevskia sp.]|nr:mechanosensitive ion channel [Nevskia sp.]
MEMLERLGLPAPAWAGGAAVALGVVLAAMVGQAIGGIVVLRILPEATLAGTVVRRAQAPIKLALPLVALQLVWALSPDSLSGIAGVRQLNSVALVAALTWLAANSVGGAADALVRLHPYQLADNLHARRIVTQARVLSRTLVFLIVLVGLSLALMTFPEVRQIGTSLLASAGLAGLAVGLAAKSVLGNLLAGVQLALTQPLRIDDVLIVQGEWGRVEEITATYVVLNIWDQRRLVIPLQWFIENPFQNWTRTTSELIGSVFLWLDFRTPVEPLRTELRRLCEQAPEWDRRVCVLQVTDTSEKSMQVRALVSAADSGRSWDLRCKVREGLIGYVQREHPDCFPEVRGQLRDSIKTALTAQAGGS